MKVRILKRWRSLMTLAVLLSSITGGHPAMAGQPVLLELFTSQGCSSCPPADALMTRLAADPSLMILSFHVDYWNSLGWTDPYASSSSTARQYGYAKTLGSNGVFTPQLIVNGTKSMVGSKEGQVRAAINAAKVMPLSVQVDLSLQPSGSFNLSLPGISTGSADVWEARFVSHAMTKVASGENGGRNLESINNVTALRHVGTLTKGAVSFTLPPLQPPDDGLAVIIQNSGLGNILGVSQIRK